MMEAILLAFVGLIESAVNFAVGGILILLAVCGIIAVSRSWVGNAHASRRLKQT